MRQTVKQKLLLMLLFFAATAAMAQQSYTVEQAIDYAIANHTTIKNAQLDMQNASARVSEIKAMGLPQVTGSVGYTNNLLVPRFFVPAKTFNPAAAEGDVVAAKFGVEHSGNIGLNFSQLVFDGSYLLGLKAADVYKELSAKTLTQNKQQIAEAVSKAYYGALVNEERLKLLRTNIARLDSLLRDTRALNAKGFVEKVDVQRLEVQANNLKTETANIERLQDLSYNLLKYQMDLDINQPIQLSTSLDQISLEALSVDTDPSTNYSNRMEYSMLQTQQHLAELDLKNTNVSRYPNVRLSGNFGINNGRPTFGALVTKSWFTASAVSLNVQVPIFDGFSRKYKAIQQQNTLQKIKNGYNTLENSIDLQVKQANISLQNSLASLAENKANMSLAKEVERVAKAKYKAGVGANLEILNAEAGLKEAQTNYFNALYNALIAKVDLQKAKGTIYNK
jgi:outer membrane protein TolC